MSKKVKHLRLSFSTIKDWQACQRKFRFQRLFGHRSEGTPAMNFGKVLHLGLEAYYKARRSTEPDLDPDLLANELDFILDPSNPPDTESVLEPVRAGYQAIKREEHQLVREPNLSNLPFLRYSVEHALRLFTAYAVNYPTSDFSVVGTERTFDIPLTDRLSFRGAIDATAENELGPMLVDYKTSSQLHMLGDKARLSMQGTAYSWAAHKLGLDIQQVMFDGLNTSWGTGNKKLVNDPKALFNRALVSVFDWQRAEFEALAVHIGNQIIDAIESGQFDRTFEDGCTAYFRPCQFADVCTAAPFDRQEMLSVMPSAPEAWDGLELEEQPTKGDHNAS